MKTTIEVSIDDNQIGAAASAAASQLVAAKLEKRGWQGPGGDTWEELQNQVNAAMRAYLASDGHAEALRALVAKKMWRVTTDPSGEFAGVLVDSTNPADQYVCVIHPLSGNPVVSVASGTKWQGAA